MKKLLFLVFCTFFIEKSFPSLENIILNKMTLLKNRSESEINQEKSCSELIAEAEKRYKIPNGLLKAIALKESSRKTAGGKNEAWPWTICANGHGYFLKNKKEAIDKVISLRKRGINVIDVGCMQVNLFYHPNAFKSLEEAFTPQKNINYAAKFLKKLKEQTGSWKSAVCYYHSQSKKHYTPYCADVMRKYAITSKEKPAVQMVNLAKLLATNSPKYEFRSNNSGRTFDSEIDRKLSERLHKLGRLTLAGGNNRFIVTE